jgi:DNA-binding NarL/FixJ family response regulator
MLKTRENLPQALLSPAKISILLVSPYQQDEITLREMLPSSNTLAVLSRCDSVESAMPQICAHPPSVVICECDLPDGNWKAILGTCEALANPPIVLVVSIHADEQLWAEVLNLGGYDVLLKPFDRFEVGRVLASSCRYWSGAAAARQPVASELQAQPRAQFA